MTVVEARSTADLEPVYLGVSRSTSLLVVGVVLVVVSVVLGLRGLWRLGLLNPAVLWGGGVHHGIVWFLIGHDERRSKVPAAGPHKSSRRMGELV